MKLTEISLRNPAGVAAAVALVCLFGTLSLLDLPLQLFPDIEQPQLSIQTGWRAASPQEIESEILEPQEAVLQGLPGLELMEGNAGQGGSFVNLTFDVGTDMRQMLVEVIGRLNRMRPLPPDANPPIVQLNGQDANQSLSWFFVQQLPGTPGEIEDHARFVQERVVPRIEAVPGVAGVNVNGGPAEELRITLDLERAAALGVGIPEVAQQAARANDVSGGFFDSGRRQYTLRFAGRYAPEDLGGLILAWRDGRPVRLGDVARIEVQRGEKRFFATQNGNPAIGLQVLRESGANVLSTLRGVKDVVAELRQGELARAGLGIEQSFDSSLFIERAIGLLSGNLFAGILLAIGVLWWFLRDRRATVLIACAIPVSLLATFVVLDLSGRSLNVISLAGLAFAVGMVMDAAVVVAENIVRLREEGMAPRQAASVGTAQVGGALLASTFTTIAVFLPVLFLEGAEGQLFGDLALTISIAVGISLLVAVGMVPAAAGGWLRPPAASVRRGGFPRVTAMLLRWTDTRPRQLGWVAVLVVLPLLGAWLAMPRLDYLPPVKRAAVDVFFSFPPGMSPALVDREIGSVIRERMKPYMDHQREPHLRNWYLLLWPGGGTLAGRVLDDEQLPVLEGIVRDQVVAGFPDTRAFTTIGELFGGFGGSARAIQIHLQSGDTEALARGAEQGRELLAARFPGANVQAFPNTDAAQPELRLHAHDRRLAEAGWNRADLGNVVRTLGDGMWLGEHFDGDSRLPVILRTEGWDNPELLASAPVHTPRAGVLPLSELVTVETTMAASQLRRVDRRRTVTLTVDPPAAMSLEEALAAVQDEVVPALREALPADAGVRVSGSADRLDEVVSTMAANFAMALLVLFLLMAAMFRSLKDSLLVMLALPMAVFGGVLGLRALGLVAFQPLDLLSMIGFIMLLGMVINNAILLVAQARAAQAQGLGLRESVAQSLDQRLRPILVCALTGVAGSLPMVLNPGPGSVIYRGLAAVTVGGVGLSLVFTLVLIPALLRLDWRGFPLLHPFAKRAVGAARLQNALVAKELP